MNEEHLYSLKANPSPQFEASLWARLSSQRTAVKHASWVPRAIAATVVAVAAVGLITFTPATRAAIDGVLSQTAGVTFWEANTSNPAPPAEVTNTPSVPVTEQKLTFAEAVAMIPASMVSPPHTIGEYKVADAYGVVGVTDGGSVASYAFLYFGPSMTGSGNPTSPDKPQITGAGDSTMTLTAETNPGVWLAGVDSVREVTVGGRNAAIVQGGWTSGDPASGADPNVKIWDPNGQSIALVWQQGGVQYTLSGSTQYVTADTLAQLAREIQ